MSFLAFAWIGAIFFGLELVVAKLILKHSITNPWLFNFVASLFFVIFTIPIALLNHAGVPRNWNFLALAVLLNSFIFILNAVTTSLLDVSIINPFGNLRTAFGVLFAGFFLGEILRPVQYALIAIIFIAGIFASLDEKLSLKSFFTWSIFLVIIDTALIALIGVAINKSVATNGFWTTNMWMFLLSQILFLFTFPLFKKDIKKINSHKLFPVAIVSLIGLIGTLAANKAFTQNVAITNAITAIPTAMILAFLFSVFAPTLLEKHPFKIYLIRFTAATVMIVAALGLGS